MYGISVISQSSAFFDLSDATHLIYRSLDDYNADAGLSSNVPRKPVR